MKRALVLAFAVVMALVVTLPAMAFFGFGYTHGVPDNDGKLFAGFEFGEDTSNFNIDAYLADAWAQMGSARGPFLGFEAVYVGKSDPLDVEVGAYIESKRLSSWPTFGLKSSGFYGDMTIHVLDNETLTWDLFASANLGVIGGILALDAEFGFEVDL